MSRFNLDQTEKERILENRLSINTKNSSKYSSGIFSAYMAEKKITKEVFNSMAINEAGEVLKDFILSLKQVNGDDYKKKSVQCIINGIKRQFENDFGKTKSDDMFQLAENALKAKYKELQTIGKGTVMNKDPIEEQDLKSFYAKVDIMKPIELQDKVFMDLKLYFGTRARENLRTMTKESFIFTIENGKRFVKLKNVVEKNHQGNSKKNEYDDDGGVLPDVISLENKDNPYWCLELYISKLNDDIPWFWQRPLSNVSKNGQWYAKMTIGINELSNRLKKISERYSFSKIYTNHSTRATTVSMLNKAGHKLTDIQAVTKHKATSSLEPYLKVSSEKKKMMADSLTKKMYGISSTSESNNKSNKFNMVLNHSFDVDDCQEDKKNIENVFHHCEVHIHQN